MCAEHVLELLGRVDERPAPLAELVRRELRGVADALDADAAGVEVGVAGRVVEPGKRFPRPLRRESRSARSV